MTETTQRRRKLPRLPKNHKIHKRPLSHPAIPSSHSSAQKVIYISASTPLQSSVKRTRAFLAQIDKRSLGQPTPSLLGPGKDTAKLRALGRTDGGDAAAAAADDRGEISMGQPARGKGSARAARGRARDEEVLLRATGRAVERALQVALVFQQAPDLRVRLRTGSLGVVDDVVEVEAVADAESDRAGAAAGKGMAPQAMEVVAETELETAEEQVPETRIRYMSTLEVGVSLRPV